MEANATSSKVPFDGTALQATLDAALAAIGTHHNNALDAPHVRNGVDLTRLGLVLYDEAVLAAQRCLRAFEAAADPALYLGLDDDELQQAEARIAAVAQGESE